MKRHILLILFVLVALCSGRVSAQSLISLHSDYSSTRFEFRCPQVSFGSHNIQGNVFTVASIPGASPSVQIGAPDLPIISEYIEIPVGAEVKVKVSDVQLSSMGPGALDNLLAPVQPAPSKSDVGVKPLAFDSLLYATDAFYRHPAAWVDIVGIARDRRLALLRISPLAYNPVTGELQQITSMTVTITYENADIAATQRLHTLYHSPNFNWGQRIVNSLPSAKEVCLEAPLHYLIVSHQSFRGQLDSFVNWKKRQGFIVTEVYTDDPGVGSTAMSIAQYVKGFYTNATPELPAPTYLLLVGDHAQIPAFSSRCSRPANDHVTDLYYATWTEGDHIPDCYYGRFSARSAAELLPQTEKTIFYESYAFPDDSYLRTAILIAGVDQGYTTDNAYRYADPAMDYAASTYVNSGNGFTDVRYYKNNVSFAPTGVTVTGSSQPSATANVLIRMYNEGCGLVNYSAHGFDDSWSQPNFTAQHASQMTNLNRPSLMIGNCCLSGKFNTTTYDACLGEALLRREGNAGAAAYIGGTNSTYWPHDFCWEVGVRNNISNTMNTTYDAANLGMYDRLFHTHGEAFADWHNTVGAMVAAGNAAVESYDAGSNYSHYYWEIYELFGDPSLMPWLSTAADMEVTATSPASIAESHYSVIAVPYAYVALVDPESNTLIAAAYADENGDADLQLPADFSVGDYELAVWAQNYKPYFQQVSFVVFSGPYVMVTDIQPSQGKLVPGQATTFDVTIVNVGNAYPSLGLINLSSSNEGLTIAQPEAHFDAIAPGDTQVLSGLWLTYIPEQYVDNSTISLTAVTNYGPGTSTKHFRLHTTSSRLVLVGVETSSDLLSDSSSTITCHVVNQGREATPALSLMLPNLFGFMTEQPSPQIVQALEPGQSAEVAFPITMSSELPVSPLQFVLNATDGNDTFMVDRFHLQAGISLLEDFESGDLTKFSWSTNRYPWVITDVNPYRGNYSLRSYENLSNRSESRLNINWTSLFDDSISFAYKVSSEQDWDFFYFYVDGAEVFSASGEIEWTRVSVPVTAGSHTFSFSYKKDQFGSEGSDCVWIDDVHLPMVGDSIRFVIDTVCQGTSYEFGNLGELPTDQLGHYSYSDTLATSYLSLLVTPQPQVHIEVIGTPALGHCLLLKATGASNYVWNTGDSAECIAVCPEEGSHYSVTGYRGGCEGSDQITLLGISQAGEASPVSVFPNPARGSVTVQADNIRHVWLINLMGQTVMRSDVHASRLTIPLKNLPEGVYFIKVETLKSVSTQKLIIK